MGAKIDDSKQEYQFSYPFVTPSGHEFSFYDTPDNQRLVIRHTSGSALEFKADGTVFLKSVKDIHINSSVVNKETGEENSEMTSILVDNDLTLDVKGKFKLKAEQIDIESGSTFSQVAATDLKLTANNIIEKATEQISIEGTKSIYMDTKEIRERVVARQTEAGSQDIGGGSNVMNVSGNCIIRNNDPNGGITLQSAGYLNLVCGAERVDVTGDPILAAQGVGVAAAIGNTSYIPSLNGRATYTHIVRPNPGYSPRGIPGSAYFEVGPGGYTENIVGPTIRNQIGPSSHNYFGPFDERYMISKVKSVTAFETALIGGVYTVQAKIIYLN